MPDDEVKPCYTMSVAARLAGLPPHALRSYEQAGLLAPARLGKRNRLYSDADIMRARHIAELARRGINMAGIKTILQMEESKQ
jgi:MerR family transcriptional regulator, heat shock protein HspR